MKVTKVEVERALRSPPADIRFVLLHGPDEAASRAFLKLLADASGKDAERIDLGGVELKADPARLADEAASMSLFGGRRYIVVQAAGDEVVQAIEALLELPTAGNPVVILTGALKPASRLLKLALAERSALTFASYVPEGRDAEKLVLEMARDLGLVMQPDIARRIAEAAGGNRDLLDQELQKFALYLDASPQAPQELGHEVLHALGAAAEGGDLSRLVDGVSGGDAKLLQAELTRLSGEGIEGIALIRAVLRRMTLLARLRAEVDCGNTIDAVMATQGKALFWKEKPVITQQLSRWRSPLLAKGLERLLEAEREAKASGGLGAVAVDEELFAICRQAARMR